MRFKISLLPDWSGRCKWLQIFFESLIDLDQFIGEILRMGSHETDPLQSFDLLDSSKELRKGHRLFQILSVGVDVLSQKHDFHDTVCHQPFDLPDNVLRLPAALPRPRTYGTMQ